MKKVTTLLSTLALATTLAAQNLPQTERQYLSGHGCDDMVEWDFFCTDGRKSAYLPVGNCKASALISMESLSMESHFLKALPMKKGCISTNLKFRKSFAANRSILYSKLR